MKQKIINFLLENADPSIILRVKKEVLGYLSKKEENDLLEKIIAQRIVQTIIQAQKADGWIGNHFHGQSKKFNAGMYDNMEVGLRYLSEKGLPPENEYISKAVNSFSLKDPFDYAVYRIKQPETPGTDYMTTAFGIYFMRTSIIVRAGHEHLFPQHEIINVAHDVKFSYNTFTNILKYENIRDVIDTHRKKLCFKPNIQWPCIYDLRVLAFSNGWRSDENIRLLTKSINHLFSFPQYGEDVYSYRKGQFYSPCGAFINRSILSGSINDKQVSGGWFETMELFARCGLIKQADELSKEYESLLTKIDDNINLNFNFSNHKVENSWGPYYGISLEEDWKKKVKWYCDILFRILMIMHYA